MKHSMLAVSLKSLTVAAFALGVALTATAAPKKVLVVTTTTGFRHSSIETAETILEKLGKSSGAFTVEFARVTPPKGGPRKPTAPKDTGDAEKFKAEQTKYEAALAKFKEEEADFKKVGGKPTRRNKRKFSPTR